MGVRKGTGGGPMVAVVAHLDTVFPEGTDVKVKRQGTRFAAPGIGDNTRGIALMLAVIRAMQAAKFQTTSDVLFVGNVGEEGEGDLRGVKFLLRQGKYKDRIKQFIAIDGGEQGNITTRRRRQPALSRHVQGSRRSQLRRVRAGQPRLRDGKRDREVLAHHRAGRAEDDLQHRRRPRRHVGQLDPRRSQHGRRHAVGVLRRAEESERGVSRDRQAGRRRGERRALDARRKDRGRPEADWRPSVRRNPGLVADRPDGDGRRQSLRPDAELFASAAPTRTCR